MVGKNTGKDQLIIIFEEYKMRLSIIQSKL